MEEEQHVCLPAGFNLKHMYWLPFVVPAQIRDHNSPVSVPLDLGQTLAQRGDLDPFPCPPRPVAQESGLDICPLDRIIVLVPLGSQQLPTQRSYGSQGLACVLWSHCCSPSLSAPPATSLIPVTRVENSDSLLTPVPASSSWASNGPLCLPTPARFPTSVSVLSLPTW